MRIAFLTDTYLPTVDGVVNSVISTKRGLINEGHKVMIFAPEDVNSPKEENTVYCKARKFRMYPGYRMVSFLPRELKALKDFNPDVIHTHGIAGMVIKSLWFSKDLGIPSVLTFHTMVTDAVQLYSPLNLKSEFLTRLIKLYLKTILRRYSAVILPASSILPEIEEIAPKMKHVEVVPTGIDTGRFRPDVDCSKILDKWNLHDNRIILSVGRMSEEKNLDVIIEALPQVKKEYLNAKLLLVGDGPAVPKYKELVSSRGLEKDVIFTGFVDDDELPQYYACAHIFATASTFETQGLVVLEALASGKPIVGADYRAIPEYVRENNTGYLFEHGNITSCAQALLKGLGAPSEMGKNARELAEEHSIESSTKKLVEIYEKVANIQKRRG